MALQQFVPVAKILGTTSAGVLSGLIISYNLVSVPVVTQTAPDNLVAKQWSGLYDIGKAVAPPYAATCSLCFGFLASQSSKLPGLFPDLAFDPTSPFALYSAAAVLIPSIIPWTVGIMKPTNDRLKQKAENTDSVSAEETQRLLQKWVEMNWVRAALGTTGALLGATATVLS